MMARAGLKRRLPDHCGSKMKEIAFSKDNEATLRKEIISGTAETQVDHALRKVEITGEAGAVQNSKQITFAEREHPRKSVNFNGRVKVFVYKLSDDELAWKRANAILAP